MSLSIYQRKELIHPPLSTVGCLSILCLARSIFAHLLLSLLTQLVRGYSSRASLYTNLSSVRMLSFCFESSVPFLFIHFSVYVGHVFHINPYRTEILPKFVGAVHLSKFYLCTELNNCFLVYQTVSYTTHRAMYHHPDHHFYSFAH